MIWMAKTTMPLSGRGRKDPGKHKGKHKDKRKGKHKTRRAFLQRRVSGIRE
jgi:hypothetical protein